MNYKHKLQAILTLMLLAWVSGMANAKVMETEVDYLVADIMKKAQLNRNYDAANDWSGYQAYDRNLKIDASAHKLENLALDFDVYVENLDNPGNVEDLFTYGGANTFQFLELGNKANNVDGLTFSDIKSLVKNEGWNHATVKLTSFRGSTFDIAETITWFRFCLAHAKCKDAFIIRLRDVKLVDLTGTKKDETGGDIEFETDYNVASLPYTLNKTIDFENTADPGFAVGLSFDAIDVSKHDIKKCYLQFDADVALTGGAQISSMGTNGQIELTSAGRSDLNEATFSINSVEWKEGKRTYTIPLVTAGSTGGSIDWSTLNFMRIYWVHMPCKVGTMTLKVDNVKIVDYTTKTSLPTIFSNGMMFQQNKPVNIWGYATAGKNISVELFKGDTSVGTKSATPDETGKWQVTFDARKGSYDKYHFVVKENGEEIQTVNDILFGEVWLAGGQSNMALSVAVTIDAEDVKAEANNDYIRFFMEPTKPTGEESPYEPTKDIAGAAWGYGTNPAQVNNVSAVAYSMVKELQKKLGVPVGFLNTAIGGSVIEAWLVREDIEADEELKGKLKRIGMYYDKEFWVDNATTITGFYNAKIGPLKGYNIAGAIWYQGESNSGRPELYASELNLLKKGWERTFGFEEGTMPFVFTQVAPWGTQLMLPQYLADLAEAMADGWRMNEDKRMGMLAIYDTDMQYGIKINNNADPIHPTNKTPIGKRFATAVYNLVYGSGEYSCPVFESLTVNGDKVVVKFSHVGDGLKTKDGNNAVHGFAIAGSDGVYAGAEARVISKDEVEVWNPAVKAPTNVTYAWATYNVTSNLMNSANIPAAPFRSSRDEGLTHYNPQDWTLCDSAYVWAVDNGTTVYAKNVGWLPSWKTSAADATLGFSTDVKAEGKAALKLDYPAGGAACGPELRYQTTVPQLKNFKTLVVSVNNPDSREKSLKLMVNGEQVGDEAKVAANDGFQVLVFDISGLAEEATSLEFAVTDASAGTIYVDNILFGTVGVDGLVTGIDTVLAPEFGSCGQAYNVAGIQVNDCYKGIVIKDGKKIVRK